MITKIKLIWIGAEFSKYDPRCIKIEMVYIEIGNVEWNSAWFMKF